MWHVEHERVVEVSDGGKPEWVAVCGCGAAGSAESLGWQHGMCGPCADRVAEFGPEAVSHAPGLLADADFEPRDVLFASDGKYVVAVADTGYRVWSAATGAPRARGDILLDGRGRPTGSPDGRFVFLGHADGAVALLDLSDGALRQDTYFVGAEIRAFWTGRPAELVAQTRGVGPYLDLVNVATGRGHVVALPPDRDALLCAVGPDAGAPRAVFAAGHRAAVARVGSDGTLLVESRFLLGDGPLNRTGMWGGGPGIVRFTPDGERLLFIRGADMELRLPMRPKALRQATFPVPVRDAAFAPDYEHLFVLSADGVVSVCNPGTLTSVRAATMARRAGVGTGGLARRADARHRRLRRRETVAGGPAAVSVGVIAVTRAPGCQGLKPLAIAR